MSLITIDYHASELTPELKARLDKIDAALAALGATEVAILNKENQMAGELEALQAAVAAESTVVNSAIVLLDGLAAKLIANQQNPAALVTLAAEITAKKNALAAAVAADGSAPPAPPAP